MFDIEDLEWWKEYWKDMPEFTSEELKPYQSIIVHFSTKEDVKEFSKLMDQRITNKTNYIWYPEQKKLKLREMGWFDES